MPRPGCSTSSMAGSTTSWSTRRRTPAPNNGRSWASSRKNFSQGTACAEDWPSAHDFRRRRRKTIDLQFSGRRSGRVRSPARFFKAQVEGADLAFADLRPAVSRRSARAILEFVDAVFAEAKARDGISSTDDAIHHDAHRSETGRVEIWPTVEAPETEEARPVGSAGRCTLAIQRANASGVAHRHAHREMAGRARNDSRHRQTRSRPATS